MPGYGLDDQDLVPADEVLPASTEISVFAESFSFSVVSHGCVALRHRDIKQLHHRKYIFMKSDTEEFY
jgi:hypothetical protein